MAQVFIMQHSLIKISIVNTGASLYPKSELARRVRETSINIYGIRDIYTGEGFGETMTTLT